MTPQNFITFLCCGDIDHTRKCSKVGPSDSHISTTKKDNKILRRNSLPAKILSSSGQIFFELHSLSLKCRFLES